MTFQKIFEKYQWFLHLDEILSKYLWFSVSYFQDNEEKASTFSDIDITKTLHVSSTESLYIESDKKLETATDKRTLNNEPFPLFLNNKKGMMNNEHLIQFKDEIIHYIKY